MEQWSDVPYSYGAMYLPVGVHNDQITLQRTEDYSGNIP